MIDQIAFTPPASDTAPKSVDELIRDIYNPGAIYYARTNMLNTLSEKRIRMLSNAIRGKASWIAKMSDPEIRARWTTEAKLQDTMLTDREIEYVFDELSYYASLHEPESGILLSTTEQVWYSDTLISEETEREIKRYAAILENVPARLKDWHPNSNNQVLNLVHPSLFPIIYGRTMLLDKPIPSPMAALELKSFGTCPKSLSEWREAVRCFENSNGGDQSNQPYYVPTDPDIRPHMREYAFASAKFCWLPTEFNVAEDGHVEIESYINNLHPVKHAAFYSTIAKVFGKFVPLLEQVVTDLVYPRERRIAPDSSAWYKSDEPEPIYDGSDSYDERYELWMDRRTFVPPQPEPFVTPGRPTKPYSLRGRRLQAIFKMSSIVLTPDNPEYKGGSWHVEAMGNERIIATGIYYYDVENITESNLAFRESVDEFYEYEQGDSRGVELAYGLVDDDEAFLLQEIGQVETKEGRCIVFPNVYQHKVGGFKLADPTKPGHRKIFAFFFIDPATRIPSTEIVPPQQQEWWADTISSVDPIGNLPTLVMDTVLENVLFPISMRDAKNIRLELIAERSTTNSNITENFYTPYFTLCEH
ncbi:hypothetical protein GGI25_006244 [Coemansia spiralis]|uniref:DUF4246 domain-containing protein n=2 Tax=Coemansia TaxID=4863 RepID=A0A9W8KTW7_9FUNG|nr:hypothetical protein EDC05_003030 [Coemansia umbellata]KAJ2621457.1 hypothetical protein GGI26_004139 [Coemansia sp. RSA 1358]KAJ2669134.1 hypothetical protein GGI25_006244 [Coemansia spiralis]